MAVATAERFPWRVRGAIYAVGTVSNSNPNLTWVLIPLWLLSLDASPVEIGIAMGSRNLLPVLFTLAAVLGAGGALLAGPISRRFNPVWLALISVAIGVALISLTPLFGIYAIILVAMALRGGFMGVDQPMIISILGRSLTPGTQGKGVALRGTANRLMNTMLPVIMGGLVELVGLENAFYVIGGVAVGLLGLLALHARHYNGFREG